MREQRQPSTVMVRVLDMQPIADQALEWRRKHQAVDGDEPMAGCHVGQTWGIVETPHGLYAVCTEGVA